MEEILINTKEAVEFAALIGKIYDVEDEQINFSEYKLVSEEFVTQEHIAILNELNDCIYKFIVTKRGSIEWNVILSPRREDRFSYICWSYENKCHLITIPNEQFPEYFKKFTEFDMGIAENVSFELPDVYKPMFVAMDIVANETLPENDEITTTESQTVRFSSASWFEKMQEKDIMLAGCGGIGSWFSMFVTRMLPRHMTIFDADEVDTSNLGGQLFESANIGVLKTQCVKNNAIRFSSYWNIDCGGEYANFSPATNIMVCGFDNMKARKIYFYNWKRYVNRLSIENRKHCLFVDGRLNAECFQIFCMRGDDAYSMDVYEKRYLFSDAEADATICSYKQTSYMAGMIGAVMTNLLINFVSNEVVEDIRDLPFYTSYNGELMSFNTRNA